MSKPGLGLVLCEERWAGARQLNNIPALLWDISVRPGSVTLYYVNA